MTDKYSVICEWKEDGETQWDCVTHFDRPVSEKTANDCANKLGYDSGEWGEIPHSFKVISFNELQKRLKLENCI